MGADGLFMFHCYDLIKSCCTIGSRLTSESGWHSGVFIPALVKGA